MRNTVFAVLFSILSIFTHADVYRVFARDKGNSNTGDQLNLPFNKNYLDSIQNCGAGVLGTSKWLNLAYVEADSISISKIKRLSFVASVSDVKGKVIQNSIDLVENVSTAQSMLYVDYGMAGPQLQMHNLEKLHEMGYTGKGVKIALFDGGFYKVDSLKFFNKLHKKGQILATRDFHDSSNNVYDDNWHGMSVLSTISCDSPGVFMGAAYEASFILARTEVTFFERHIEELYYLRAMEWADSLGADIIHASLGYVVFDSAEGDYQYPHMDGNSTIITRAADIAASRGIIVTNSAGNLGAHPYGKITAPCDGDSVLCVGAVDMNGYIAPYSSRGPSADGRVKPDVVANGHGVVVVAENDSLRFSGGTSFAGPIIAGLAACLKQAHPERSNMEIIHAIRESADRFHHPNETHGYGIPDAMKAHYILKAMDNARGKREIFVWPNPLQDDAILYLPYIESEASLEIIGSNGQVISRYQIPAGQVYHTLQVDHLSAGLYFLRLSSNGEHKSTRFIRL